MLTSASKMRLPQLALFPTKMSPYECKANVCSWRSDKDGETFYDIDDVHKKMWELAPHGFRARYNQLVAS